MKLYASPLACSGAVQMTLFELGIAHETEYVDIYVQPHLVLSDKSDYALTNPKGAVPALVLDSGELLTEVSAILQYLSDLKPMAGMAAQFGTIERYKLIEWLSFIGSDFHKTIGPIFNPRMPEEAKAIHRQNLHRRVTHFENELATKPYLTGEAFTIADAYLFVMIGWDPFFKFDLAPYPNLKKFHERVAARESFARLIEEITPVLSQVNLPKFPASK